MKYKYLLGLYFILWIVLFEFILPVNNILPKPSVVLLSFSDLWKDYNLPVNYISTVTSIYISLVAAYILVRFFITGFLKKGSFLSEFILSLEWFSEFIPGIVIGLLLVFWFPNSELIEFVFAFLAAFTSMLIFIQNEIKKVPGEFVSSVQSLGVNESKINRYVLWKAVQPSLIKHILTLHFYIWSMIIAFEYIKQGFGLGSLFRNALEYNDLSALFSVFVITGVTVYLGSLFIKYIKSKFFNWSAY
jgi:ABC-type nitrate/sulfonate/bicarbonate transport system permease component